MKYILILILLGISFVDASAQNYSCVSSESKTYFTNSRGYLRGMRMDSVKVVNGNTVYYPFRTARTNYMAWADYADTMGGSWWGKQIVESTNGLTYLFNVKGDTILINNAANVGDSWIFLDDTSAVHYTAEVASIDTQAIGSLLDSVKIITLTARDVNGIVVPDSVNGLQLRLSKHSGLLTAIDFYMFPYRQFLSDSWPGTDCYFHESVGGTNHPGKDLLTYNAVAFEVPDSFQVFNYNIGHRYHFSESSSWPINNSSVSSGYKIVITNKTITPTAILYDYNYWRKTTVYPGNAAPATSYDSGASLLHIQKGLILDTTYMPEEWYSGKQRGWYYYYLPDDSSFCLKSPRYSKVSDKIINNRFGGGGPEPSYPHYHYKEGIGEIRFDNGNGHPESQSLSRGIESAGVLSDMCNPINQIVSIDEMPKGEIPMLLYPNPVHSLLHLEGPADYSWSVSVYDVFGKKVNAVQGLKGRTEIDMSGLSPGIYFLKIYAKGKLATRKITVVP
jgi:hypothetical protein